MIQCITGAGGIARYIDRCKKCLVSLDLHERVENNLDYIVSAATDVGLVKKTNQDSYHVRVFQTGQGKMVFAILCDGMGGLEKGEVASASVVNAFRRWADERLPILSKTAINDNDIRTEWTRIASTFNEKIKTHGAQWGVVKGTTVTAILITSKRYYIINVGDTRAYRISEGVEVLTKDQTLVAREVELGNLTPEQAEKDPRRSILLQCIGASEVVYPDIFYGDTKPETVYMLCSDGFRHVITEDEIHQYLDPHAVTDADDLKSRLVALIELNKERRERDNITVVAVKTV